MSDSQNQSHTPLSSSNLAIDKFLDTSVLPPFFNGGFDKGQIKNLVGWFLKQYGEKKTIDFLERLKSLGFHLATNAGISLGIEDLQIPPSKPRLISDARRITQEIENSHASGSLTGVEKSQWLIDTWNQTSDSLRQNAIQNLRTKNAVNPVYMMAFSGARGNVSQVRQLVAMRGLMADPQGAILEFPIQSNFREGLTITEYLISCYGARKGLVDTALRTATSGYLTRRLVASAQHAVISIIDCQTRRGIILQGNQLEKRLIGRVLAETITTQNHTFLRNHIISDESAKLITETHIQVLIRSPLTCSSFSSICQYCYGWNLASGKLVNIGEAVGVIAAQSIGEPGTQLTMRTFHTGGVGVFSDQTLKPLIVPYAGKVIFEKHLPGHLVRTPQGKIVYMIKPPQHDSNNVVLRVQSSHTLIPEYVLYEQDLPYGSLLFVKHGENVEAQQMLAQASFLKSTQDKLPESSHPVYSPHDGQIFFESDTMRMYAKQDTFDYWDEDKKEKKLSRFTPIFSATGLLPTIPEPKPTNTIGTLWVFSGQNQYETHITKAFVNPGDLVGAKTILFNYRFFSDVYCQIRTIQSKLAFGFDLFQIPIYKIQFRNSGYKLLLTPNLQDTIVYQKNLKTDPYLLWYPSLNNFRQKTTQLFYSYQSSLYTDSQINHGIESLLKSNDVVFSEDYSLSNLNTSLPCPSDKKASPQYSSEIVPKGQLYLLKNSFQWTKFLSLIYKKTYSRVSETRFNRIKSQLYTTIRSKSFYDRSTKLAFSFRKNDSVHIFETASVFLETILKGRYSEIVPCHSDKNGLPKNTIFGDSTLKNFNNKNYNLGPVCFTALPEPCPWLYIPGRDSFLEIENLINRQFIPAGHCFGTINFSKQAVFYEYLSAQTLKLRKRKNKKFRTFTNLRDWYSVDLLVKNQTETPDLNFWSKDKNGILSWNKTESPELKTFFCSKETRLNAVFYQRNVSSSVISIKKHIKTYEPISKALIFHSACEYSFSTFLNFQKKWFSYNRNIEFTRSTDPVLVKQTPTEFQLTSKSNIHFHFDSPINSGWLAPETLRRIRCSFAQTEEFSELDSHFKVLSTTGVRGLSLFFYQNALLKNLSSFSFNTYSNDWIIPSQPFTSGCVTTKSTGEFRYKNNNKTGTFTNTVRGSDLITFPWHAGKETLYVQDKKVTIGAVIRWGEEIKKGLASTRSGQVIKQTKSSITLRLGTPILSSAGGIINVSDHDLIAKNQLLITLKSRRLQTEDIVQGIPKIEQLFEARQRQGGEALEDTVHTKLRNAFARELEYISYHNWSIAVEKSVLEAQAFLVENVMSAYGNQGVKLAEKHVEVIVRQMTSRVRIVDGGETGLLPGELVLHTWIQEFNASIRELGLREATYEPIVVGISKTVLQSDSFLVAASFQEVSRVLVRSALSKKRDFLSGLHENVIVGQVVPAGTGLITNLPLISMSDPNQVNFQASLN